MLKKMSFLMILLQPLLCAAVNPLHDAALPGNLNKLEQLLEDQNLDINQRCCWQKTAIMVAAERGNKDAFYLLMRKKPNLSLWDCWGKTVLHWAASVGKHSDKKAHLAIIKVLLRNKADPLQKADGDYPSTPLYLASAYGSKEIMEALLEKALEKEDLDSWFLRSQIFSAFLNACHYGNEEVALYLFDNGVHIDDKDSRGRTGFFYAAMQDKNLAKKLLKRGANFSEEDQDGQTVLYVIYHYFKSPGTLEYRNRMISLLKWAKYNGIILNSDDMVLAKKFGVDFDKPNESCNTNKGLESKE